MIATITSKSMMMTKNQFNFMKLTCLNFRIKVVLKRKPIHQNTMTE